MKDLFDKLRLIDPSLKLTDLRKAVLEIIAQANKPISAAEILQLLKRKRDSAEPPTVYRVIEYLLEKSIIHKIAVENKYVLCSQLDNIATDLHGFILICKKCSFSQEVAHETIPFLTSLVESHQFIMDGSLIEIKGICKNCSVISCAK